MKKIAAASGLREFFEDKNLIEISHISKEYMGRRALKDLSFTLEKGKIYGFLGPNGAGKSTTMNIMTGYMPPTSGSVTVNGFDILSEAEKAKKNIGYLPEIPPLYPDLTVSEYLEYASAIKKISRDKINYFIKQSIELAGLESYSNRLIRNLSKGYKQRTGLACALLGMPENIILDEPTAGMDPQQIIEVRNLILSLKSEHALMLSSHVLSEISEVCDELIIISRGELVIKGGRKDIEDELLNNNAIHISAACSFEKLKSVLEDIEEIKSIEREYCESSELVRAVLTVKKALSILEQDMLIAKKLFNAGIIVSEIYRKKQSLEDLFLNATVSTPSEDNT